MKRKFKPLPTRSYLKRFLRYDPESGKLFWIARPKNAFCINPGDLAGECINGRTGYQLIGFEAVVYLTHRVIYRIVTGVDPKEKEVDHINTLRTDNRWINLRLSTSPENQANRFKTVLNKSGVKGVCWCKFSLSWEASVKFNHKRYRKNFKTLQEGEIFVRKKREELHREFTNHG